MKKILELETRTIREVYVEPIEENKDYVYFKDFHTEYHGDKRVAKGVISGITLKSCTENLGPKDVVDNKIPVPWMYEGYGSVVGIPKEKYDDIVKGRVHIHDVCGEFTTKFYDPEHFVYCIFNYRSWKLATLDKEIIPIPMHLDYIDGQITDRYYDLEKLLEYLLGNPEKFVPSYGEDKIEITDIPYYNADDSNGYKQIKFCCILSENEARTVEKERGSYMRYQKLVEILGLSKFKKEIKEGD